MAVFRPKWVRRAVFEPGATQHGYNEQTYLRQTSAGHLQNRGHVSIVKPEPISPQPVREACPICGKPSYSRDGIHPQCALSRSDAARTAQLKAKRKAAPKPVKPPRHALSKKCPLCGTLVHIRMKNCPCGHEFARPNSDF